MADFVTSSKVDLQLSVGHHALTLRKRVIARLTAMDVADIGHFLLFMQQKMNIK